MFAHPRCEAVHSVFMEAHAQTVGFNSGFCPELGFFLLFLFFIIVSNNFKLLRLTFNDMLLY